MAGFALYQYDPTGVTFNPLGIVSTLPVIGNEIDWIYLPDGIQIDSDVGIDVANVVTQKKDQLLAGYGYEYAHHVEFTTGTAIDTAFAGTRGATGNAHMTHLFHEDGSANPGRLTTTAVATDGAVTVTDYVIVWDVRRPAFLDAYAAEAMLGGARTAIWALTPAVRDPDEVICRVSCDGGTTFDTVLHGVPTTPTVGGASLRVQFETQPAESEEYWLGGYYLLYNGV